MGWLRVPSREISKYAQLLLAPLTGVVLSVCAGDWLCLGWSVQAREALGLLLVGSPGPGLAGGLAGQEGGDDWAAGLHISGPQDSHSRPILPGETCLRLSITGGRSLLQLRPGGAAISENVSDRVQVRGGQPGRVRSELVQVVALYQVPAQLPASPQRSIRRRSGGGLLLLHHWEWRGNASC